MPGDPVDGNTRPTSDVDARGNPPESVLRPAVRRAALFTYFGILVAVFLIAGAGLLFWNAVNRLDDGRMATDPSAVGTSGERQPRDNTPGGFTADPSHGTTRGELEYRGTGEPRQGPMPGLRNEAPLTNLSELGDISPRQAEGRRIDLKNVEVERADAGTFWVRSDDASAQVFAPGDMPTVRAGQRVDISGALERSATGMRIRASRIDVK
jgi:hypothetical protein